MALHLTEMMATDKVFEAGKITATLGGLNVLHTTTYSSSRLTAWAVMVTIRGQGGQRPG